jgi:hypothetical protein
LEVLNNIPFRLDVSSILSRLRLDGDGEYADGIRELAAEAESAARPKAAYAIRYVENKEEGSLEIGGIKFSSRVLRKNLDKVERVFAYVATCGRELDSVTVPSGDPLAEYCLDMIKEKALRTAGNFLKNHLKKSYALGQVSKMSPGELSDWPLTEQINLFELLGDVEAAIGVRLTESCLMVPVKSVSGIISPTEISFESCQLCLREDCRERRAVYDPKLADEYGFQQTGSNA